MYPIARTGMAKVSDPTNHHSSVLCLCAISKFLGTVVSYLANYSAKCSRQLALFSSSCKSCFVLGCPSSASRNILSRMPISGRNPAPEDRGYSVGRRRGLAAHPHDVGRNTFGRGSL